MINIIFIVSFLFNLPFIITPNHQSQRIYAHTQLPHYKIFPVEKTLLNTLFFYGEISKLRLQDFFIDTFEGRLSQIYKVAGTNNVFYFLNGYLYQRPDGFYMETGDRCELTLRTDSTDKKNLVFPIQNYSYQPREAVINVGSEKKKVSLLPGEVAEVTVDVPHKRFSKQRRSFIDIRISVRGPHFWGLNKEHFRARNKKMVFFTWPFLQ